MENDMTTMADESVVAHQLTSYKDVARTCSLSLISDFQRLERQLQREMLRRLSVPCHAQKQSNAEFNTTKNLPLASVTLSMRNSLSLRM